MSRHPLFKPYAALAAVCLFWGTTYLAIRMALEMFPPFLLVATRFTLSGAILLAFAKARGLYIPRGRDLVSASFTGVLALGIGTGGLVYGETLVPSGIAGLIITISPFWLVGLEALLPGGDRLHAPTIAGMLVGLFGASLLFVQDLGAGAIDHKLLNGFLIISLGIVGWSFGSILQRRRPGKAHPVIAGAVQQLAAGLAFVPVTLLAHEDSIRWSARGVTALLYLVAFGSIVGYSAYVYAMDKLPVAIVSIYPYVNAVVAVSLGWLFYREPFGKREAAAMVVIFAGVALVKRYAHKK